MGIDYKKKYMKYKKKYLNLSNRKLDLIIGGMDVEELKESKQWGFDYDHLMENFQGTETQRTKFLDFFQKTLKINPEDVPATGKDGSYIRFYTKKYIGDTWEHIEVTLDNTIRRVFGDAIHDLKHKLKEEWYGEWKDAVYPILKKLSNEGNERMVLAKALQDPDSSETHSKASIVHNKEKLLWMQNEKDGYKFDGDGVFEHNFIPHRQRNISAIMLESLDIKDGSRQEAVKKKLIRQRQKHLPEEASNAPSLFGEGAMLMANDHGADAAWASGRRLGVWVMKSPLVMFDQGATNLNVADYESPIVSREKTGVRVLEDGKKVDKFTDYYTVKNNFEGDDIFAADYYINDERYIYIVQVIGGGDSKYGSTEATIIRYMFKCTSAGNESKTLGGGVLEGGGNYSKIADNMTYQNGTMALRLYDKLYKIEEKVGLKEEWFECPLWVSVIAKHHGDFISNIIETIRQDATLFTHDFKNVMLIYAKYRAWSEESQEWGKWELPNCGLLIHPNNPANPHNDQQLAAYMEDAANQKMVDEEGALIEDNEEDTEIYDKKGDEAMIEEMNYYNFVLTADGDKTWLLSFSPHKPDTSEFEKNKYNRKVLVKRIAQLTEKINYLELIKGAEKKGAGYMQRYLDINKCFKKLERPFYIYLLGIDIEAPAKRRATIPKGKQYENIFGNYANNKEEILRDILRWKPQWTALNDVSKDHKWAIMVSNQLGGLPEDVPHLQAVFYNLIKELESENVAKTFKEKIVEELREDVCELNRQSLLKFCKNILYKSIMENLNTLQEVYEAELEEDKKKLEYLENLQGSDGSNSLDKVEEIMEGEAIGTFSVPIWPSYDDFYEEQDKDEIEKELNVELNDALDLIADRLKNTLCFWGSAPLSPIHTQDRVEEEIPDSPKFDLWKEKQGKRPASVLGPQQPVEGLS